MIEPKKEDIGNKVVIYKKSWMKPTDWERGIITGFNDSFVFVRYGKDLGSESTKREDLFWEHEKQ